MRETTHVAVYHNAESMGYEASEVTEPVVVTNKRVSAGAIGSRLWLLVGLGRPRRFYLRGTFVVAEIESGADEGYRTRIWGRDARFFEPMIALNDEPWFEDFKRSQGSFAFGYQTIRDERFVRGLERCARRAR
jgi:hypothetical protein